MYHVEVFLRDEKGQTMGSIDARFDPVPSVGHTVVFLETHLVKFHKGHIPEGQIFRVIDVRHVDVSACSYDLKITAQMVRT